MAVSSWVGSENSLATKQDGINRTALLTQIITGRRLIWTWKLLQIIEKQPGVNGGPLGEKGEVGKLKGGSEHGGGTPVDRWEAERRKGDRAFTLFQVKKKKKKSKWHL